MVKKIAATILVPTTGDRGLLLPYSIGSIQRQTISNIEILVIGDGVDEDTRQTIRAIAKADPRVRFFDHPKHERRGEPYRNAALKSARGKIVCYLCDRDLMLKNHVERMVAALKQADLAFCHMVRLNEDGSMFAATNVGDPEPLGLSLVAHRLDFYQKLPFGWRTTPKGNYTDIYMWQQFTGEANCRVAPLFFCSIIYLQRGAHPGMSTLEREKQTRQLYFKYIDPGESDYEQAVYKDLITKEYVLMKIKAKISKFRIPLGRHLENRIRKKLARKPA